MPCLSPRQCACDRLQLYKLDLDAALESSGIDYLVVVFAARRSMTKGTAVEYQFEGKSKRKGAGGECIVVRWKHRHVPCFPTVGRWEDRKTLPIEKLWLKEKVGSLADRMTGEE